MERRRDRRGYVDRLDAAFEAASSKQRGVERSPGAAARAIRRGRLSSALIASRRTPPRPGRFLETRFLKPLGISQTELAAALGVSRRRVNELVRGRRAITPDTALRLALLFGNDGMFWMHLQVAWDMHAATRRARARSRD